MRLHSCVLTAILCLYSLIPAQNKSLKEPVLLCSFYPMYIMTLNIADGIEGITVKNMTNAQTGCLHDYQLSPQDMKTLASASVLIINGAGMESFISKALSQQKNLHIIEASKGISLLKYSDTHNSSTIHSTDNKHFEDINPHVWVSVSGAIEEVKNIADGLAAFDPLHGALYLKNARIYIGKLDSLRNKMHQGLSTIQSRDIITFHEAFPYFAREFNLNIAAVIEREPGSQPSARELAETITLIKSKKIKALFAEPQYPAKAAQTIAQETGLRVYSLDPAVTGEPDKNAYVNIMESNLKVLQSALQ